MFPGRVCFDLVTGLLSDPTGQSARNVLVHHISVATIATDDQSTNDKKYGGKKSRRMLLETATAFGGRALGGAAGALSQKKNAKSITVAAKTDALTDPNAPPSPPGSPGAGGNSATVQRDGNGPKNLQAITYPLIFIGVPVVVLAIVLVISTTIMTNFKIQKQYQYDDMPAKSASQKSAKERGGMFGLEDANEGFDRNGQPYRDTNQESLMGNADRDVRSNMGRRGHGYGR